MACLGGQHTPSPRSWSQCPATCAHTVWKTTKFCMVISLGVMTVSRRLTTNADARSVCGSWRSCRHLLAVQPSCHLFRPSCLSQLAAAAAAAAASTHVSSISSVIAKSSRTAPASLHLDYCNAASRTSRGSIQYILNARASLYTSEYICFLRSWKTRSAP